MQFAKMHGTGNDYVIVDCLDQTVDDPAAVARAVSDRHTGIGSDGLILVQLSDTAAVRMEMYNADGSRGKMCGNGIRCVAKYAFDHGLTRETRIAIETDAGLRWAECTVEDDEVGSIRIDMGEPSFAPGDVPVLIDGDDTVDIPVTIDRRKLHMTCVSMGNPHAVIFVDKHADTPIDKIGPKLERDAMFPDRANIHTVEVKSETRVNVLTWERGSGRTQACGTGVCAVCAAAARTKRTGRRITAEVLGGELELHWTEDNHIHMTGPAVEVFTGTWKA